ncbi:MAG TPA: hypothetical protein VGN72_04915 [Tepidisphaeraceae bacterium]|jgi:FtsZ-binding cell division protein ZapB|nr:hypothetical protein [Tepidisphaeraceae bacterium]
MILNPTLVAQADPAPANGWMALIAALGAGGAVGVVSPYFFGWLKFKRRSDQVSMDQLNARLLELAGEVGGLKVRIQHVEADRDRLLAENGTLTQSNGRLVAENNRLRNERNGWKVIAEDLQTQIKDLKSRRKRKRERPPTPHVASPPPLPAEQLNQ